MQHFTTSLPDWSVAAESRTTTSIWCTGLAFSMTSKPICLKSTFSTWPAYYRALLIVIPKQYFFNCGPTFGMENGPCEASEVNSSRYRPATFSSKSWLLHSSGLPSPRQRLEAQACSVIGQEAARQEEHNLESFSSSRGVVLILAIWALLQRLSGEASPCLYSFHVSICRQ